jgi:hypothetical protein
VQNKIDLLRGESQVYRPCFQKTGSIFIHIPKAAGTSIARSIYGMNIGHKKVTDYIAISKSEFLKYYRFSIVRNPWDRLVSAYHFARQGGTSYVQPIPNPIYQSKVFSSFDTFVKEWLPSVSLKDEDVIFQFQHEYIYVDDKLMVDFVGKLENIDEDFKIICNSIGVKSSLARLNTSNKNAKSYQDYYDDRAKEIVEEVYAKDIDLFKYSF